MELVTAAEGWAKLRLITFTRDKGCVAVQPRVMGHYVATDQCRDVNGWVISWDNLFRMEWDHVKQNFLRYDDEAHGITVCPWHHRGSGWRIDKAEHREKVRAYLASLYPAVWNV